MVKWIQMKNPIVTHCFSGIVKNNRAIKRLSFQYPVGFFQKYICHWNQNSLISAYLEDKINYQLKDLRSATMYKIQLEATKRRRYQNTTGIVFEWFIIKNKLPLLFFQKHISSPAHPMFYHSKQVHHLMLRQIYSLLLLPTQPLV